MKKLYMSFILLFAFVVFAPCFAEADVAIPPSPEEIARYNKELQLAKEQNKKDIECLSEIKEDIPKEYKGPNLKIEKNIPQVFLRYDIDSSTQNIYYVDTYLHVFGNFFDKYNRPVFGLRMKIGQAYNCKEYILLNNRPVLEDGQYNFIEHVPVAYDITDVPPGSYLKYIPETEEFQVLPPTEESYKEIMKGQMEKSQKRNKTLRAKQNKKVEQDKFKQKEKIKNIISCIIFAMGIMALIFIFTRGIRRKL
ncbi:MAG: hypothetical protein J6S61_03660 [Elusimicrobiaceae bacterium]|nr:hypothetical protein [Elusimicrobiaceae bacterium]